MIETDHYIKLLRDNWWFIALTGLIALSLASAFSYIAEPQYRARARFLVSPGPSLLSANRDRDLVYSLQALETRSIIATYAEIMSSDGIYQAAGTALQITPKELRFYQAGAVTLPETSALDLTVVGPDPTIAAMLANQVGQHAIDHINGLYQAYAITTLDPAKPSSTPFSPTPERDAALALFVGIFVSISLILISDQLIGTRARDGVVRSHTHLGRKNGVPASSRTHSKGMNRKKATDTASPAHPGYRTQATEQSGRATVYRMNASSQREAFPRDRNDR